MSDPPVFVQIYGVVEGASGELEGWWRLLLSGLSWLVALTVGGRSRVSAIELDLEIEGVSAVF